MIIIGHWKLTTHIITTPTYPQKYTDSNGNSDDMDGSSFSSFYSSFIKTTDGSESPPDTEKDPKHRKLKVFT